MIPSYRERIAGAFLDFGGGVFNVRHPDFGAVGDGRADDTRALQLAIDAAGREGGTVWIPGGRYRFTGLLVVPANVQLMGAGNGAVLFADNSTGNTISVRGSGVTVADLVLEGGTPGGIRIEGGAADVTIRNVHFRGLGQCVWLWTCSRVSVESCRFENTGYGVIQQRGHVSDGVRVAGCTIWDARADFVEANCTLDAPSRGWIIEGNRYLGHAGYGTSAATAGPENRFIGITAVEGVVIAQNYCQNSGGDSAIHLEDVRGEIVILGNILKNCHTSHQNLGYIYLLHSEKHSIIAHNVFMHDDVERLGTSAYAVSASSGAYTHHLVIEGNRFVGVDGGFGGLDLRFNFGPTIIANNQFVGLSAGIAANVTQNVQVIGNYFVDCTRGIMADPQGATGGACVDWMVGSNVFHGTRRECILIRRNTHGTTPSGRWMVQANRFDADVLGFDTEDMIATGNVLVGGAKLDLGLKEYTGSRGAVAEQNFRFGNA